MKSIHTLNTGVLNIGSGHAVLQCCCIAILYKLAFALNICLKLYADTEIDCVCSDSVLCSFKVQDILLECACTSVFIYGICIVFAVHILELYLSLNLYSIFGAQFK